ncbi:MAG: hypothetical protein EBW87_04740 [Burkholderiaceae bacterium]|nr:hypothetical protein [Burkholderiaceae bacterium]
MTHSYSRTELKKTGIYKITCTVTGKLYIGSTSLNFHTRWYTHVNSLKRNAHCNPYLQFAWNKHGSDAFKFEIIEECEPENCIRREQYWIDLTNSTDHNVGYNLCAEASSCKGVKRTEEQRNRMREAAKKRGISNETRQKMMETKRKYPRVISEAERLAISKSSKGRKPSKETVEKISNALRGKKHGPEVRKNMSIGQKGKKHSEATKLKMSKTRKGRKYSEAHRKAISDGIKARHAKKQLVFTFE